MWSRLARIFRREPPPAPEITAEQARELFAGPARPGLQLAGFTVEEELASGEMAKVLKVRDARGRAHAMKVPVPALVASHEFLQRFTREMQLGARLNHPNIVRIEEVHVTGHPFIIMELVEGVALDRVPRDDPQTLRLAGQALEALEAIHAAQVVHRDLKPSNMMVTRQGTLKVMDFGVAHDRKGARLTAADQVLGTPLYMAPEQLMSSDPGPAADLYALGLVLYERLAGELPFTGNVVEIITRKLNDDPPSLALARPDLSAGVVEFVMRLLERQPERRYESAARARQALREVLGR